MSSRANCGRETGALASLAAGNLEGDFLFPPGQPLEFSPALGVFPRGALAYYEVSHAYSAYPIDLLRRRSGVVPGFAGRGCKEAPQVDCSISPDAVSPSRRAGVCFSGRRAGWSALQRAGLYRRRSGSEYSVLSDQRSDSVRRPRLMQSVKSSLGPFLALSGHRNATVERPRWDPS
jgi:hypothetical protein